MTQLDEEDKSQGRLRTIKTYLAFPEACDFVCI